MNTKNKNSNHGSLYPANPAYPAKPAQNNAPGNATDRIPVNGFQQVLEMLRIADPAFRESLLNRLAQRDRELARTLRQDLANLGIL